MNKKKGKENQRIEQKLVNYKDLERNVLNEISKEFHDDKKNKDKGK
jgi:hypothetical protein